MINGCRPVVHGGVKCRGCGSRTLFGRAWRSGCSSRSGRPGRPPLTSRVRWNIGRARRSLFDIRNERATRHRSRYVAITSAAGISYLSVKASPFQWKLLVPMEMVGEVDRCLHAARAHDESQAGVIEGSQVYAESVALPRRVSSMPSTTSGRPDQGPIGEVVLQPSFRCSAPPLARTGANSISYHR